MWFVDKRNRISKLISVVCKGKLKKQTQNNNRKTSYTKAY